MVVFGLLAAILGLTAVVLVIIALVRAATLLVGSAWGAYLVIGGLFTLGGLFLWQQASKRPDDSDR